MSRPGRVPAVVDLLAVWLLTAPGWLPLLSGRLAGTHDGYYHLYRFLELERAVRAGDPYPRWAPDFALGFGYPVFNYYPPLALYLALPFRLVGLGLIEAFDLGQIVAALVAGAGGYALFRSRHGRLAGVVAGVLYGSLPYLLIDLYVRGAIAETLGLALLPWVCLALRRLTDAPTSGRLALGAAAVALLALGHNITALLALPVAAGYALLGGADRRRLLALGAAGGLGLAVSALYWLPALLERDLIASDVLTTLFYDFHNHFQPLGGLVQTTPSFDYRYDFLGGFLFKAGLAQVVLALIGAAFSRRRETLFWLVVAFGSLLLQERSSAIVWESVPLLRFVQFPWRLLTLVGLATVALAAGLVAAARPGRARLVVAALVVVAWLGASFVGLRPVLLDLHEDEVSVAALNRIELDRRYVGTTTSGEYMPHWVRGDPFELWARPLEAIEPPAPVAAVLTDGRDRVELTVNASADGRLLVLDQHYFPTWRARVDGRPAAIEPFGEHGLLAVRVPPMGSDVVVEMATTPRQAAATGVSVVGLAALALLWARPWRRRRTAALALGAAGAALIVAAPSAATSSGLAAPATFEGGPRLLSVRAEPNGELRLRWTTDAPIERPLWVALRLLDERGSVVAGRDKPPRFGLRPTTLWRPGYLVTDLQQLSGPTEGRYSLAIGLFDDRGYLAPNGGAAVVGWPGGVGVVVGILEGRTLRPAAEPVGDAPPRATTADGRIGLVSSRLLVGAGLDPAPGRLERLLARLTARPAIEGDRGLVGRLGGPGGVVATVPAGAALGVDLLWRALADVAEDYALTLQLLDHRGRLIAQDDEWPRRGFSPTTLWSPGQETNDRYALWLPPDAPAGRHRLALGIYARRDLKRLPWRGEGAAGDWLELGSVKVPAPSVPPPVAGRVFGGVLRLIGVETRRVGTRLEVRPTWRVEAAPGRDYTVFVHALDGSGRIVAQGDAPPLDGGYPTSLWEPGEVIVDRYVLALPAGTSGRLRLLLGLYRPDTGERLPVEGGADALEAAEVDVGS